MACLYNDSAAKSIQSCAPSDPARNRMLNWCLEQKSKQHTHSVALPPLSDAYDTAKMLCEKYYLASPQLKIEEFNSKMFFFVFVFRSLVVQV